LFVGLIYVICVCLRIVVSNTFYVCAFCLCFFLLCTLCYQFLWIVHFLIVRSVFSDAYSPPFSIEIIVPNQESKQSGIVVLEVL
jgi:hypothetical protein